MNRRVQTKLQTNPQTRIPKTPKTKLQTRIPKTKLQTHSIPKTEKGKGMPIAKTTLKPKSQTVQTVPFKKKNQ